MNKRALKEEEEEEEEEEEKALRELYVAAS
jgi:hypothetical protein